MSKLDELVAIARKELKSVEAQRKITLNRKDAAEQMVAKIRAEVEALNTRHTDLASFIDTYDLAIQQCGVVENLALHSSNALHHHRTAGAGKAVIAVSMKLLTNGTREIKAEDVFVKCKHDGVTVEKAKIASALIYEANKPDGMIERIRTGVYARRETHVNGASV